VRASATHLDNKTGRQAHLVGDGELTSTRAVALLLHGGKENSVDPVDARQAAVLRMVPVARHLVASGAEYGLAVWRLRFRYRGWNNAAEHPLADVAWALRQMRDRHGGVPIVLVGHSMGGRAALRSAREPAVAGVLGLAPWVPPDERYEHPADRRLLVVHGLKDRITSAANSRALVKVARASGDDAAFIGLRNCGHAMLRRVRLWNRLTAGFVLHAALGIEPRALLAEALATGDVVV
jgi:predicted esterase